MTTTKRKRDIIREFKDRLFRSRFFAVSALFHAFLVTMLGTAVLMNHVPEPPDFTAGDGGENGFVQTDTVINTPPPPLNEEIKMATTPSSTTEVLTVDNTAMAPKFVMPAIMAPAPIIPTETKPAATTIQAPRTSQDLSVDQARRIKTFTGNWSKGVKGGGRWNGTGAVQEREFEFTAYLAKYAGGDWNSTNNVDPKTGNIWRGSLPNLISFVNTFSKGRIKASSQVVPLDLSKFDEEINVKKPPFIFFTGHRDFVLTDKEVESLRRYIQSGGCIWGDSSLPGLRSRFDLAFRREMRRIISDEDKDWEILPPNYPLYTKNPYFPEVKLPPPGVNGYKEPIYALKYGGEVAVIYTPNDYSDMWRIALNNDMKIDETRVENSYVWKYTDDSVFLQADVYYRGLELPRLIDSYKFGTNIIIHFLTRWEDRIKNIPTGL